MIIETCPKCGSDLETLVITTVPPIPAKRCQRCGFLWEGRQQEIVRIPFKELGETYLNAPDGTELSMDVGYVCEGLETLKEYAIANGG